MRSTSLGFALGIFLISLCFPLESSISDSRAQAQENEKQEPHANSAELPKRHSETDTIPLKMELFFHNSDLQERLLSRSVRGYRRITAKNVLEHKTRQIVYDLIGQNPGIDLNRLSALSVINENTLRYHLDRIADEELITIQTVGKSFHYFQNTNQYSDAEQQFYSRFSSGSRREILQIIGSNPGITRRELADKLRVASPSVTRIVQELEEQGYINLEKQGKYTRHYLPHQSAALIHRIIPA